MMRRILTIIFLALFLAMPSVAIPPDVEAYVLHGYHLLDLMLKEIGSARELQVVQKSTVEDALDPGVTAGINETVNYLLPGAFRSEFASAAGDYIYVYASGRSLTILNKRIVSERESDLDRYKDIFLFNKREALKNHLVRLGMAPDVSSVGRFQGTLVYVLGAQYPDETVPQLWLDKNTFMPVRWLLRPASTVNLIESFEVRYHGWRKTGTIRYPFQVEMYQGDRLLRKIQVARVQVNPKLSHRLFDIAYLKSIYPTGDPLQSEKPEPGKKSEVQKTIERFRRLFE
jgi:outer membrane lipoprotein-sorting protein